MLFGPTLRRPVSQLCTAAQFAEPVYAEWRARLGVGPERRRKYWEWAFIAQVLRCHGKLVPGMRGVGFGVGSEPLPRLFAGFGCDILATDQRPEAAAAGGWSDEYRGLGLTYVDMRDLSTVRGPFDFAWSSCSLEHLGSPEAGLDFVCASVGLLARGGVAVHTTEFLTDEDETITLPNTVLYAEREIRALVRRLRMLGCVVRLNLRRGRSRLDRHVDLPPYRMDPHIRLEVGRHVTTSVGIVVHKR